MKRALEIDSDNVLALVSLALLELSHGEDVHGASANSAADQKVRAERAWTMISAAYSMDSENPMVLNHLADHFQHTVKY